MAFHPGDLGSIPSMDQQIFKIIFFLSHPSGVNKHSSFKLATSEITSSSMPQKGESDKGASIKAYLLLQGLTLDIVPQ
jgi:hypothetical protein